MPAVIAYLSNQFPSPVEPYVVDEIRELRKRGLTVIPCSARAADLSSFDEQMRRSASETLYFRPLRLTLLVRSVWICLLNLSLLSNLLRGILLRGHEPFSLRLRALAHTWLGAYYAAMLAERRAEDVPVQHIHVHHGYFSAWIAMVAAHLLWIDFSVTLHGSDLLLHAAYLDEKLRNCKFCLTISEYNRRHILQNYPDIRPDKVIVQRLGVDPPPLAAIRPRRARKQPFVMLSVGRLHPVKNHEFLLHACRQLKDRGLDFLCLIAGDGPERSRLELLAHRLDLDHAVKLLGHVPHDQLDAYYAEADVVVLTSRSEGIPLTLMEAMAQEKIVLAPAITGIAELVINGKTGFLYAARSLDHFVGSVEMVHALQGNLRTVGRAARDHILKNFNRNKNLAGFGDLFLSQLAPSENRPHEDPVLQ